MTGPPDDAYGRVTNPERFAVLHDLARTLVTSLVERFDAEAVELAGDVVRVRPRGGRAAAVSFTLTDFPGVRLVAGRSFVGAYPSCGCDACDERPHDVAEDLRWDLEAITGGGLAEAGDGRGRRWTLQTGERRRSAWSLDPSEDLPWSIHWAPWPERATPLAAP